MRPGEDAPRPAYAPKGATKFYANRRRVYALVSGLDGRYRRGADTPVHNPITDNVFVKDAERYGFANNCNHLTGRMLRGIGCEVRGTTATPRYKVVGKQALPPAIEMGGIYANAPADRVGGIYANAPAGHAGGSSARARRPPPTSFTRVDVD